jgi:hypothetical protein
VQHGLTFDVGKRDMDDVREIASHGTVDSQVKRREPILRIGA